MTYREEWKDFIKRELVTGSFGTEVKLQEYYEKSFEQNQPVIKELIENELSSLLQGEFTLTIQKDSIIVDYSISGNTAKLTIINDYGSEDLEASLTYNGDGSYTFKQLKGSTINIVVNNKWVKLPKTLIFK